MRVGGRRVVRKDPWQPSKAVARQMRAAAGEEPADDDPFSDSDLASEGSLERLYVCTRPCRCWVWVACTANS